MPPKTLDQPPVSCTLPREQGTKLGGSSKPVATTPPGSWLAARILPRWVQVPGLQARCASTRYGPHVGLGAVRLDRSGDAAGGPAPSAAAPATAPACRGRRVPDPIRDDARAA